MSEDIYQHVAFRPDELPQQRLFEWADLPARPAGLEIHTGGGGDQAELPRHPRNRRFLACVEWAWSPMHERISAYYLSGTRRYWVLWVPVENDFMGGTAYWNACAYCRRLKAAPEVAACWLLAAAWEDEKKDIHLDHFHFINSTGAINVSQLRTIAAKVWPEALETSEWGDSR